MNDYTYKWTDGHPYQRSMRFKQQMQQEKEQLETSAYTTALHHDENTWEILNLHSSSKREEIVTKMSAREPIQQIGHNPFMTHHTYIEDVAVRDNFLKPINTTQGSLKDSSK